MLLKYYIICNFKVSIKFDPQGNAVVASVLLEMKFTSLAGNKKGNSRAENAYKYISIRYKVVPTSVALNQSSILTVQENNL